MDIAIVTHWLSPQVGGIAHYTDKLIEILSQKHKVVVLQPENLKQYPGSKKLFMAQPMKAGATYFNVFNTAGWYLLDRVHLDVVHSTAIESSYAAYVLSKLSKAKLIITIHGNDFIHAQKSWYKRKLFNLVANRAYKLITVSNSTKKLILEKCPELESKLVVINPGVDEEFFAEDVIVHFPRTILSVAKLRAEKGIDTMIKAMEYLPEYEYQIVGSGPDEARLKELAKNNPHIFFKGEITDKKELRKLYRGASVFVLPSRFVLEGKTESFGIVFLEAMASGTPCISYKLGGIPEAFGPNTGILLEDYTPEALADAIKKTDVLKMAEDCISWAHKFNWENQVQKIEREYQ